MKKQLRETAVPQEARQTTPEEYAENKVQEIGRESYGMAQDAERFVRDKAKKQRENSSNENTGAKAQFIRNRKKAYSAESGQRPVSPSFTTNSPDSAARSVSSRTAAQRYAQRRMERNAVFKNSKNLDALDPLLFEAVPENTIPSSEQVCERPHEISRRNVITADKSVKTAEHTVRESEKKLKTLERNQAVGARAAKAAKAKAIQKTGKSKKTAEKAASTTAKVIRAAWEAVKKLVLSLAGGSTFVFAALAVMAVMTAILLSAFGIFWSNDTEEGNPMTEVIQSIDTEYRSSIDMHIAELSSEEAYDEVRVIYRGDSDGDSASVNNWNDVLGVYAVLHSDNSSSVPVITVTDNTESDLREIFYSMNSVEFDKEILEEDDETAPEPTPDPNVNVPEKKRKTVACIYVTQSSRNYREAAESYGFTEQNLEVLEELMSPAYYTMFAKLVGVDVYGGTDLTQIVSGLPANSKGAEVVKAALTKLGAPYVWGAKGENKFDCSGLSYWSIRQVDPSLGGKMYTNAAGQAKYCSDRGLLVGASELMPGDLVFWQNLRCGGCHRWQEVHHVGIYAGNGKVVEASSSKGRVVVRELWSSSNYPIFAYGRPYGN
ncbi:MAG: C40 family peptidase [Clostridia bacterium]|nr:C40 family peptidase [Clostridia bacterium]